jgi:hypothetical protein
MPAVQATRVVAKIIATNSILKLIGQIKNRFTKILTIKGKIVIGKAVEVAEKPRR